MAIYCLKAKVAQKRPNYGGLIRAIARLNNLIINKDKKSVIFSLKSGRKGEI